MRAKGIRTGDGAQWFRSLAVDGADGNFMLWCTDVGGLFRSLDGGANWEPANVGFHSRGSAGSAIDPRNPRRAIVIAANSAATPFNGVYLSTDQAAFWKHVMPLNMAASLDCGRTQVVFDPSSYDSELGYTRVVYWSRLEEDKAKWGNPEEKTALYRSDDGGENWEEVPGGEVAAGARLAVHPLNGNLYAANRNGVMLSTDGGRTWETTLEGAATGVSVSPADPDTVWASQPDSIWRSGDGGRSWERTCAGDVLAVDENFMDGDI